MRILVTGVFGQDGSILADYMLAQGHEVWGTTRKVFVHSEFNPKLRIVETPDSKSFPNLLNHIKPDQIYHLAAKHNSSTNFNSIDLEIQTEMYDCHVTTTERILEWQNQNKNTKSLIALSSQMYSPTQKKTLVTTKTKFRPSTFYGATKLEALKRIRYYRENFGISSFGAILFNHTSTRSKPEFLFPSLAKQVASILMGKSSSITLVNKNALLDICHAEDVCRGLVDLLNCETSCDVIFSSGKLESISTIIRKTLRKFNHEAFVTLTNRDSISIEKQYLFGELRETKRIINWQSRRSPDAILAEIVQNYVLGGLNE